MLGAAACLHNDKRRSSAIKKVGRTSRPANRMNGREVLDCASPLALGVVALNVRKRQRTAAVQDATATIHQFRGKARQFFGEKGEAISPRPDNLRASNPEDPPGGVPQEQPSKPPQDSHLPWRKSPVAATASTRERTPPPRALNKNSPPVLA